MYLAAHLKNFCYDKRTVSQTGCGHKKKNHQVRKEVLQC